MRLRPRINRAGNWRQLLARTLLGLLGLAIAYYGAMALALALKADPATIQSLSGYRTAFDELAGLRASDATGQARLIAGLAGLTAFVVLAWLAAALVPRPHIVAEPLALRSDELGAVTVHPRVIERAARAAAIRHANVRDATARYADGHVDVAIAVTRADALADALRDIDRDVRGEIAVHDLPAPTVRVTVTRYRPTTPRELR